MVSVNIEHSKCIGCEKCVEFCPRNVFELDSEQERSKVVNEEACFVCMACVSACDADCIEITDLDSTRII